MAHSEPIRTTYLTGHSSRKGLLGITAFPEEFDEDIEFTMFYTTIDDKWWHLEFDFDVTSVTYLNLPKRKYRGWWLIGKRGEVVEFTGGDPEIGHIATAGTGPGEKYGYLAKIRVIDDTLFICGFRRQIYHRVRGKWKLITEDILDRRARGPWKGFNSIDGFSKNDIYAVGYRGEIWHYDGKTWVQCDSPTNQHLTDVRCLDDRVWICGKNGIILCGDKNSWEVVWDSDEPAETWWSIESFQGNIYVAGALLIGKLEDGEVVPVDVGIKAEITSGTLHHKEGILWSIGAEDVLAFDGTTWKELICPDNR